MQEYLVVQDGPTEFNVVRLLGEIYYTIAKCGSRDYAEQIAAALNPEPELRRSWTN